jgi:Asp-tRNA(Asn)/Glu-tRNA(Gln) amidotransferase A subunit family amidase
VQVTEIGLPIGMQLGGRYCEHGLLLLQLAAKR